MSEPTTRRLLNIVRRMIDGEDFYFSETSPRISRKEVEYLTSMGFGVQEQDPLHEPHIAYCEPGEVEAWKEHIKEWAPHG